MNLRWWVAAFAACMALLPGCDDAPPPGPAVKAPPEWSAESTRDAESLASALEASELAVDGALTVQLAFGERADLDLYVTGPFEEAVYYANTPSEIGGALEADRRCGHAGPRIETIRFVTPLAPGRYRVGVDYPHACGESDAAAPYALRVTGPGGVEALQGLALHRVFAPIVLEFEIARAPSAGSQREVDR